MIQNSVFRYFRTCSNRRKYQLELGWLRGNFNENGLVKNFIITRFKNILDNVQENNWSVNSENITRCTKSEEVVLNGKLNFLCSVYNIFKDLNPTSIFLHYPFLGWYSLFLKKCLSLLFWGSPFTFSSHIKWISLFEPVIFSR